jgi:hypothetical protein
MGHKHGAERRQRHEVEDHGELQEGQQRDDELLVAGHGRGLMRGVGLAGRV